MLPHGRRLPHVAIAGKCLTKTGRLGKSLFTARGRLPQVTKEASVNVEVPEDIVERIRALCLALPEVTVRVDQPRIAARSTAWPYEIRRRSFCLLVAWEGPAGGAGGGRRRGLGIPQSRRLRAVNIGKCRVPILAHFVID
jgi:hypothetical protein